MAPRPSWQGHLKLSLVTCPVMLVSAISPQTDVRFHLINPDTGNRIRMITVDSVTEEALERRSLLKGFEIDKDTYVTLTPEEINSVRLESTKTIEIDSFVAEREIDRLYWDSPYFLLPDGKLAGEPYAVIRESMARVGQIALGRAVISQRERLLAIEARESGMIATTLRSHDEVRASTEVFAGMEDIQPNREMIEIAEKIIAQKQSAFAPDTFRDRYQEELRALIEEKRRGHSVVRAVEPEPSNVIDLMAALRASLDKVSPAARPKKQSTAPRRRVAKKRARS